MVGSMTDSKPGFNIDALSAIDPLNPVLYVVAEADETLAAMRLAAAETLTFRLVRGRKMRTVDGLFNEFSAALQFPNYFGENWAAFDECLGDLDWLPARGIVVLISEPDQVLVDAPRDLPAFGRVVRNAAGSHGNPIALGEWWDRPALPFRIVLASNVEDADRIREWWQTAGVGIGELPQ